MFNSICKFGSAVDNGAVNFIPDWEILSELLTAVQGVAESLQGSHKMDGRRADFSEKLCTSLIKTFPLNLLSA